MKALSIKQPWANLIAQGEKTIEVRTWKTEYRGELLIVSSQRPRIEPFGQGLCIVKLLNCRQMTEHDLKRACLPDYHHYTYAWELDLLYRFEYPFPVKGKLSLYDVDIRL